MQVCNFAVIGEGPENAFCLFVVKHRPKWSTICDPRPSLFKELSAAALRKCASGNNTRPSTRRYPIGHPQTLSRAIGGSQMLTTFYNDRAAYPQLLREEARHKIGIEQQITLRQRVVSDQRNGAGGGAHSNLSAPLVNPC